MYIAKRNCPLRGNGDVYKRQVQTCENLLAQGITPDVYYNGHLAYERDDVKEHNDALVDKYYRRMRNL